MWRKKKILENIEIQKIGYGWVGIVKLEDWKTLLVKWWVLPGMIVDVKITKKKKDYIEWLIVNYKWWIDNFDLSKICKHNFILEQIIKNREWWRDDGEWLKNEWESQTNIIANNEPVESWKLKVENIAKGDNSLWLNKDNLWLSLNNQSSKFQKSPQNFQISIGCWWCKWQVLPYEEQLKLKENVVKDSFAGIDFFGDVYEWIVPAENIFNYRNKMEFSFGKLVTKVDGKAKVISDWNLWFHKQGQFSKIVDVSSCLIGGKKINEIYAYLKNILKNSGLPVYDNYDHSWFFRHLVIREGFNTWQVLVNLSVATKFFDKNKDKINLWTSLQQKLYDDEYLRKNITTFVITENNWLADVVKWQDIKVSNLWWGWHIFEKLVFNEVRWENQMRSDNNLFDLTNNQSPKSTQNPQISITFRISAFSFFQTNTLQAQKLFQTAIDMLPSIKWNILDLYCGAGTIWLTLLKLWIWEKLLWVEIVKDAVIDANANAKLNWLFSKAQFIADKAENINFEAQNIWLVVVDPPRSWLHKNVIEFLANLKKNYNFTLLYISCNPVTMARDWKLLTEKWFKVQKLKAVDMFPHTHHIEMVGVAK